MLTDGLDQGGAVQITGDALLPGLFTAQDIAGFQRKHIQKAFQLHRARWIYKVLYDIRFNSPLRD